MAKEQKVFNCDLFCTEDFVFDGVVRITGNFYASANIQVDALEVGGDMYLISPDRDNPCCIDAIEVSCNGLLYMENFEHAIDSICVGEQLSVEFTGPVLLES